MENKPNDKHTYRKVFTALESDYVDVVAPESMRKNVNDTIEKYSLAKALLELHVLAPGLLFGVEPDEPKQDDEDSDSNKSSTPSDTNF